MCCLSLKDVAKMIRPHLDGMVASAQTHHTNGFVQAINGSLQVTKMRERRATRIAKSRTVIVVIAGRLDFQAINPHAGKPT